MGAELPITHVLLHLAFGPTVAWVVTALSACGWLCLWAEYRATLALDAVHSVEPVDAHQTLRRAPLRLRLRPGTTLQLPWGEREMGDVLLGLDEPERFMRAVSARREA
jgi:hypothetical protein